MRRVAAYDRKADWPMEECTTGEAFDKCPKDKLRQVSFSAGARQAPRQVRISDAQSGAALTPNLTGRVLPAPP
jgi:hypothetical protein